MPNAHALEVAAPRVLCTLNFWYLYLPILKPPSSTWTLSHETGPNEDVVVHNNWSTFFVTLRKIFLRRLPDI